MMATITSFAYKWYIGLSFLIICLIPTPKTWSKVFAWFKPDSPKSPTVITLNAPFTGITSINILLVKEFIQCIVYNNLSVLGAGTPLQLQQAFSNILSEYYEVKKDASVKRGIKIRARISIIEHRWKVVDSISSMMDGRYSNSCAAILTQLYPSLQFTPVTWRKDINRVHTIEIKAKIEHSSLIEEMLKMDKETKQSPKEKHHILVSKMMDINKTEGSAYDWNNRTVLEFAVAENRMKEYIDNLNHKV